MGSRSRALFLDLLDDLSDHLNAEIIAKFRDGFDVQPWPDITLREFRALALVKSFYKKLVDETESTANAKALTKFLAVNETAGKWELCLTDSWDEVLWGELKRSVYDFVNPKGLPLVSSFDEILHLGRCGPGASVGSEFHDFYSKLFSSKLSTTSKSLYRAYRCYIKDYPEWSIADIIRRDHYGESDVVEGNRLQFVPKTRSISRTICIEPALNMFMQLGLGRIIEDRLNHFFGISLSKQPDVNRELARIGSLRGIYSTVDLESASDSISLRMLRELLPADFLCWLEILRSPSSRLPDGRQVDLNMVSTMGNGFTFPLQTMLFACAVTAAARARGFRLERPRAASEGSFGVFGDDIIIPTNCHYNRTRREFVNFGDTLVRDVFRLLRLMGFTVNSSKSFWEGPFRESCGADYFRGHPVRGVYVKTLLTPQSRFVAMNLLNRWCATSGFTLKRVLNSLRQTVPRYLVPIWESDDSGLKVPFSMVEKYTLHDEYDSIMYRKFEVRPRYIKIKENGFSGNRVPIYNSSGLLLSFLNGAIRSCKIGVRSNIVTYRGCFGIAPNWDSDGSVSALSADGLRWKSAVLRNLKT